MDVKILEQKENPLLDRVEVVAELSFPKANVPSREAVIGRLSALLNADRDRFVLREIKTTYGETRAIARARVYETVEIAKKVEPEFILKRNKLIGEEGNE